MKPVENKIKLANGEMADRDKVCFRLANINGSENSFRAIDGTIYSKQPDGSLLRMTPKKEKNRR